jgi:Fe-S-cluster containining protein
MIRWLEKMPICRIYNHRPRTCTTFPIDERDLRDRDILFPEDSCGFSFVRSEDVLQEHEESPRFETASGL